MLASTLTRFQAEQQGAMEAAMHLRSDERWFEDAVAALEAEQAGDWESDEELASLALREFPFYFATHGDPERAYLQSLQGEIPVGDALRLFNVFDLRPELPRIAAPTLVVTGEDDFTCAPVSAREIAAEIDGAELVLIPDCGHFVFVEQPRAFADTVVGFLS